MPMDRKESWNGMQKYFQKQCNDLKFFASILWMIEHENHSKSNYLIIKFLKQWKVLINW